MKLTLTDGKLTLSVNNPESGSATEELAVDYGFAPSVKAAGAASKLQGRQGDLHDSIPSFVPTGWNVQTMGGGQLLMSSGCRALELKLSRFSCLRSRGSHGPVGHKA